MTGLDEMTFSDSKQGRHTHPFALDDEDCQHKAAHWVCANASAKGKPNKTATKCCNTPTWMS